MSVFAILVRCEAVEEALPVGFGQIRLGAAARAVRGVPGTVAAAIAVGKTNLGVEPAIGRIQVGARPKCVRWPAQRPDWFSRPQWRRQRFLELRARNARLHPGGPAQNPRPGPLLLLRT